MTPNQLAHFGESIYGDGWQSALARDLDIADRTVRRWIAGEFKVPDEIENWLIQIIDMRIDQQLRRVDALRKLKAKLDAKQGAN